MNYPRLLLIDMTPIGGSSATGALKSVYFADWPMESLVHLRSGGKDQLRLDWGKSAGSRRNVYTSNDLDKIESEVGLFRPDVIFYRPVSDHGLLHKSAMRIIEKFHAPLAVWLMDDWPERLKNENTKLYNDMDRDIRQLLERSRANFAISHGMADIFGKRYGTKFDVARNGVTRDEWSIELADKERQSDQVVKVRYAGSLAPDTTKQSVYNVAVAISELAQVGLKVQFEAMTHKVWYDQCIDDYKKLPFVSLGESKMTPEAYRKWLSSADVNLIAYNFDEATKRYLQYSFANKVPEVLAAGASVLVYGPTDLETVKFLQSKSLVTGAYSEDQSQLKTIIEGLVNDKDNRLRLGKTARDAAFEFFSLEEQKTNVINTLKELSVGALPFRRSMVANEQAQFVEGKFVFDILQLSNASGNVIDIGAKLRESVVEYTGADWKVFVLDSDSMTQPNSFRPVDAEESAHSSALNGNAKNVRGSYSPQKKVSGINPGTLMEFMSVNDIRSIELLNIDVANHAIMILDGLNFDAVKPKIILAGFANAKTSTRGYSSHELASILMKHGYIVYISEWHPMEHRTNQPSWRHMRRYPCDISSSAWGKFIAFAEEPSSGILEKAFTKSMQCGSTCEAIDQRAGKSERSQIPIASARTENNLISKSDSENSADFSAVKRNTVVNTLRRIRDWSLRKVKRHIDNK